MVCTQLLKQNKFNERLFMCRNIKVYSSPLKSVQRLDKKLSIDQSSIRLYALFSKALPCF